MDDLTSDTNTCSVSNISDWKWAKIRRAPSGRNSAERSDSPSRSLLPWPRKKPLNVTMRYLGGQECWWEIKARGRTWRRPGHLCLQDVLSEAMGWINGVPPRNR